MPNLTGPTEIPESDAGPQQELDVDAHVDAVGADPEIVTTLVLAEVLPGVAVAFGDVPEELDLVDLGFLADADRRQLAVALAPLVGNSATVVGNVGNALAAAKGVYVVDAATQSLLNSGAVLAVKDGANLGSVWLNGKLIAQARFIPVSAVSAVQLAASIGPALALIGLQVQLNQLTGLVSTNIALTSQVLAEARHAQWAELTGLTKAINTALDRAREIRSVPTSLWDTIAGREADLRKQLDLYRRNVARHVKKLEQLGTHPRREYLEANAEAVLFDANALLTSLKTWTAYQALHAGKARAAGPEEPDEAQLVDIIARDTRLEFEAALAETRSLVDSLRRALGIIAELPERGTVPLTRKRKDVTASRLTSAQLLEAMEPLAAGLRLEARPLGTPQLVAAPGALDLAPYLRVLRWTLQDGETLRALAFPYQLNGLDLVRTVGPQVVPMAFDSVVRAVKGSGREHARWTEAIDRAAASTLVAFTDRRVVVAEGSAFTQRGEIGRSIPLDHIRYVRLVTASDAGERSAIDLITRDENLQWLFHSDAEDGSVAAIAALLAESMAIPQEERDALLLTHSSTPVPTD